MNITECETPIVPVTVTASCGTSGLQSFANNHFSVYPNPVSGEYINISGNVSSIENIKIYNAFGQIMRIIKTKRETSTLLRLSVENLPTGIYLLKVTLNSGETAVYKLSVVK